MAQSRHTPRGEVRIPRNNPYNRIRHVSWGDHNDVIDIPPTDTPSDSNTSTDDSKADEPKVWTF